MPEIVPIGARIREAVQTKLPILRDAACGGSSG
jgi:hypothetical protein